jgi:hypothetical protein
MASILAYDTVVWKISDPVENWLRTGRWNYDEVCANVPEVMSAIEKATCCPDVVVRRNAYVLLVGLHERGELADESAVPCLATGLRDPIADIRQEVLWHLHDHPALALMLRYDIAACTADCVPELRAWAISCLDEMGPEALFAMARIERALRDPDSGVQGAAKMALEKLTAPPTDLDGSAGS